MEDYWIENVYNLIKRFSNLNDQKEIWLGFSHDKVSSYGEDGCMLYDDNSFDDFIIEWKNKGMDKNTLSEMILFRDMYNAYNTKVLHKPEQYTHLYILNDPEWFKVVAQAGKVISVWRI